MLNITSSMAVAFRRLATEGFRPKGTLIYFGVADEEAGGHWGAEYMIDEHWDAVGADYVLTETGGWSAVGRDGIRHVTVNVAEKGLAWRRLRVHGTPGHGSMPYGADNALITSAEIIRRLVAYRPEPNLDDLWTARIASMDLPDDLAAALTDPARIADALASLPTEYARAAHACSHTTISPNVIHGGQKTNTIPDVIDIDVDIRTVPGDTKEVVDGYYAEILGELADRVEISPIQEFESTRSPIGNPLWDALLTHTQVAYPGADLVPGIITGGTDARFYRAKGAIAYGTALFSPADDDGDVRHPLPRQRRARRRRVARPVDRVLARHRHGRSSADAVARRPVSRTRADRPAPHPLAVDELGRRHQPGARGDGGRRVVVRVDARRDGADPGTDQPRHHRRRRLGGEPPALPGDADLPRHLGARRRRR